MPAPTDVTVAGAGPAGLALAGACARRGLRVVVVDPRPERPWRATYGMWEDEVPHLPAVAIAARPTRTIVRACTEHALDRRYLVLDNTGLRTWLGHHGVRTITGRAVSVAHGPRGATVRLADGRLLATGVVVDATGAARALSGGPARGPRAEQTAFGVRLPADVAGRLLPGGPDTAVFMDWRSAPGFPPGTFGYALPLGDGRVLVEETCLAGRPALGLAELEGRLAARLSRAGVTHVDGPPERVRIILNLSRAERGDTIAFGTAGGFVHPATGHGLATSLRLAPRVADAVVDGLARSPHAAARAARKAIWPARARIVHGLRRRGLHFLCSLPPAELAGFFELFFSLPAARQRAFLSGREDLAGTTRMMATLFRKAPGGVRFRLVR